jgi:hypothetical protein
VAGKSETCAHCGIEGYIGPEIVPYSVHSRRGKVRIRWLHGRCSEAWHARYREWLTSSAVDAEDPAERALARMREKVSAPSRED